MATQTPHHTRPHHNEKHKVKLWHYNVCNFADGEPSTWDNMKVQQNEHHGKGRATLTMKDSVRFLLLLRLYFAQNMPEIVTSGNEATDVAFGYALAFVDKTTGLVTYAPAKYYAMYKSHVSDCAVPPPPQKRRLTDYNMDYTEKARNSASFADRKRELALGFGSAKSQKMAQRAIENRLAEDTMKTMVEGALSQVDTTVKVEGKEESGIESISALSTKTSSLLPPFNASAREPKEIYRLSEVFPPEMNDIVAKEITPLLEKKVEDVAKEYDLSLSLLTTVRVIQESKYDTEKKARFASNVFYCAALCKFTRLIQNRGKRMTRIATSDLAEMKLPPGCVAAMKQHLLGPVQKTTKRMVAFYGCDQAIKDRIRMYALTMGLLINQARKIELTEWSRILALPERVLVSSLQAIGCDVDRGKSDCARFAVLKYTPQQVQENQNKKRKIGK